MEIIIPMPQATSVNTYKGLMGYLKQLELAVHYAQKSVESAEKIGVPCSEDSFINWNYSALENSLKMEEDKNLSNLMDNYFEEFQSIELKINIQ